LERAEGEKENRKETFLSPEAYEARGAKSPAAAYLSNWIISVSALQKYQANAV
jgi:hypothetical protein